MKLVKQKIVEDGVEYEVSTDGTGFFRYEVEGVIHREKGPAIIYERDSLGRKGSEWYKHGRRHRDDGPAVENSDGYKEWWNNGRLHRDDGPAVILSGTSKHEFFYFEGMRYEARSLEEFKEEITRDIHKS